MATSTLLTSGGAASGTSANTASISPAGSSVVLVWIYSTGAGSPPTLGVTGTGLSFSSILSLGSNPKIEAFYAVVPANFNGSVQLTLSSSVASVMLWEVVQVTSVTTSATPIVTSVRSSGTGTTGSVTFPASYTRPLNSVLMAVGHANTNASTPEAGWNEIDDFTSQSLRMSVISAPGSSSDLTPSTSWTGSVSWIALGVEILDGVLVSESMTIAEGAAGEVVAAASPSESLTIAEVVAAVVAATTAPSESLTIAESVSVMVPYSASPSESLTIAEAVAASLGSASTVDETMTIVESVLVEGGWEVHYDFDAQNSPGGGSNAGYIASATSSSYESFAAKQDPTLLQGLEDAWQDVPDPMRDAWEAPQSLGDAPPLEELEVEAPEPLAGAPRRAIKFAQKKRGLAALGDLLPNPASGALGSGASTVAGYAAAKAGKMIAEKIEPRSPTMKKHGKVIAGAVATGVALLTATKVKSLRDKRGEIALGGLLAVLELASEAYGQKDEVEIPNEHQNGIALVGTGEEEE